MRRVLGLAAGVLAGLSCAGIAVALAVPALSPSSRSEALVWAIAAVVVVACVGAGLFVTRPTKH